jgi:hypothetical protein
MKKLIIGAMCLALLSVTGTALAVDDATVQAIDNKAASANSKADGNNSRIQGLEADVADLQSQIDAILDSIGGGGDPNNSSPLADAGEDINVCLGDLVALDGSGSGDPEADDLTYSWQFVDMPAGSFATLNNNQIMSPSFWADMLGVYTIKLIVSDGNTSSNPSSVQVLATECL